ncbi:hypothetical protein BJY00DRAFT_306431 [Aspergillus carlsbadensis]|nr:hypothetical protein BJY00DRAFT_306431 [Aspergillus carlsbadensis]
MPPVRSHRKSRTGCLVCRKRRVKCDESGHPCANCAFRGVDCAYPDRIPVTTVGTTTGASEAGSERPTSSQTGSPAPPLQMATAAVQPHSAPPSAPPSLVPAATASSRLQLELMHTFSTETYKSLFAEPTDNQMWQVILPRRALEEAEAEDGEGGFLLDGILSAAALHTALRLSSSSSGGNPTPEDLARKQLYIDAAMQYQSRAFEPYQRALQCLSRENCDIVFGQALITVVNGIALPQVLHTPNSRDSGSRTNMLETVFTLFELVQGTAEINRITGPWLKDKDPRLVYEDFWDAASRTNLDAGTEAALKRLSVLNDVEHDKSSGSASVDTLLCQQHGHGHGYTGGYGYKHVLLETTISLLRQCFRRYTALHDPVSVLTWLAMVDRGFVECVRRHETLPLLVLMHWGTLLARLEGVLWWAGRSGRDLVGDVLGILGGQPGGMTGGRERENFESALSWVREDLGL